MCVVRRRRGAGQREEPGAGRSRHALHALQRPVPTRARGGAGPQQAHGKVCLRTVWLDGRHGRSKSPPLATDDLLENTNGVHRQCSLGAAPCHPLFMLTRAILMPPLFQRLGPWPGTNASARAAGSGSANGATSAKQTQEGKRRGQCETNNLTRTSVESTRSEDTDAMHAVLVAAPNPAPPRRVASRRSTMPLLLLPLHVGSADAGAA